MLSIIILLSYYKERLVFAPNWLNQRVPFYSAELTKACIYCINQVFFFPPRVRHYEKQKKSRNYTLPFPRPNCTVQSYHPHRFNWTCFPPLPHLIFGNKNKPIK